MSRDWCIRRLQVRRCHVLHYCIVWILYISVTTAMSLTVHVPPHEETCIFFRSLKGLDTVIRGTFEVISDRTRTPLPVKCNVYNEQRFPLYTSPHGQQHGAFELLQTVKPDINQRKPWEPSLLMSPPKASSERWSICFENGKPNPYHPHHWDQDQLEKLSKLVSLSIMAEPKVPPGFATFSHEQKTQHVLLSNMAHKFEDLLHHMNNMRVREAEHRNLAEQTYSGLILWTLVLFVCLILVAVGQVMSIMRFFQAQKRLYH